MLVNLLNQEGNKMFNLNQKHIKLIICLFSLMLFSDAIISAEKSNRPDYYFGKVIFTDTHNPVQSGFVKVYTSENNQIDGKVLAIVEIQSDGVFKLPKGIIHQTDGIKIMAYANDLDNFGNEFNPIIMDFQNSMKNSDEKFDIIISVVRTENTEVIE
jgi:hypothetical protein